MPDLLSSIAIILAWTSVMRLLIARQERAEQGLLWLSFALHQIFGVGMVLMTRFYYEGGDMLSYYHPFGVALAARLREDLWGTFPSVIGLIFRSSDPLPVPFPVLGGATGSMQGLSTLLMYVCSDSIYAACLFMASATFVAKLAIYRVLKAELDVKPTVILGACLLMPSVVFWSSAMLKEPFAIIGIGMLCHGGYEFVARRRPIAAVWFLAGAVVVALVKPYILPPFGMAAGLWYYLRALQRKRSQALVLRLGYGLVAVGVILAIMTAVAAWAPEYGIDDVGDAALKEQVGGVDLHGGSKYSLGNGTGGQVTLIPFALLTALFRPALFEVSGATVLFAALEMTFITAVFLRVFVFNSPVEAFREILKRPILVFCTAFVITLGVGVGLGSTNLGSLSRYRMPMMPFFGTALLALEQITTRRRASAAFRSSPRQLLSRPHPS